MGTKGIKLLGMKELKWMLWHTLQKRWGER